MRTEGKDRLGEVLFAAFLVAVGAGAVLYTGSWPVKAALYPRVVGSALVLASLACCVLAALDRGEKRAAPVELELGSDLPAPVVRARTLESLGWIGGFLVAGWLVGLIPAMVLLVLAYLRWVGRESWWFTGMFTVGTWAVLEGFMVRLLHLPIPTGVLASLAAR